MLFLFPSCLNYHAASPLRQSRLVNNPGWVNNPEGIQIVAIFCQTEFICDVILDVLPSSVMKKASNLFR
jgi:hypothetical protein